MNNPLPVSVVVFDCDGVLLESVEAKTEAFAKTVQEHGPEAAARLIDYHRRHGGVSRHEKFKWFYRQVLEREITDRQLHTLAERFRKLSFENVKNAPMVPGAMNALQRLYGRLPIYVASGAPHEELAEVLSARNLDRFFHGVYGSPPGKTELLRQIIEKEKVSPETVLMVGDSPTDLTAAEECGTLFYGRGKEFESSGREWGEDLMDFMAYLS